MKTRFFALAGCLMISMSAAALVPASLFQNGMVLQRDRVVPVWGQADPGAEVKVEFAGQSKTATADAAGRWMLRLDALATNAEGQMLKMTSGTEVVEVADVLVGEVWLGSGQSNMQWSIAQSRQEDQDLAASGEVPMMRLFQVPLKVHHARQDRVDAKWVPATPENARGFSAVAYFFGRRLAEELKVPVGIIHSSWGGSRIEPWWAEEGLEGMPELADLRERRLQRSPGFPEYDRKFREFVNATRTWSEQAAAAMDRGLTAPEMPAMPERLNLGHNQETGTYQAMIHPLAPYALRGFIWYQGESNNGEGMAYEAKMRALIRGWRMKFESPEAPFYFVQLAPFNYGDARAGTLPEIWWAQQETLKFPHTGMAVTNDIGNVGDIHPRNKSEVGRRLSLWALADVYGRDLVKSGPLYAGYKVIDQGVAIRFDHVGGGLAARDGKALSHFEIAGADGQFHPANAEIREDRWILLSSPQVPKPDRARFAWSQSAEPNLMNREGLPAAAFHTHWPVDPTLGTKVSGGKPHQSSHPNAHNWDNGLTDGVWADRNPGCYATSEAAGFPKSATVDLGEVMEIHVVIYGTPNIGSTKTVAIEISADGKEFREIGRHDFPNKKAARHTLRFDPTKARFVRAVFLGNHPAQDGFSPNFGFLSEIEVYAP
ncbi:MAG: discoidin domain-containing protein [Akkermansiaceae bacterium]|nr:discoidin domain-containing protein [Akkermansiaceae bacterium]